MTAEQIAAVTTQQQPGAILKKSVAPVDATYSSMGNTLSKPSQHVTRTGHRAMHMCMWRAGAASDSAC